MSALILTPAERKVKILTDFRRIKNERPPLSEKAARMLEELQKEDSDLGQLITLVETPTVKKTDEDDADELAFDIGEDEAPIRYQEGDGEENLSFISAGMRLACAPQKTKQKQSRFTFRSEKEWAAMFA